MVWACHKIQRTYQDHPTRNCTRREERQAEKEMGGQHHKVDRKDIERQLEDREQKGMERADLP